MVSAVMSIALLINALTREATRSAIDALPNAAEVAHEAH